MISCWHLSSAHKLPMADLKAGSGAEEARTRSHAATGRVDLARPLLPIGRYRLIFQASEPLWFRGYTGSAWRGLLGQALKKLVCVTRCEECPACLLYRSCVYTYVFETPPPAHTGKLRRYTAVPHPFVLSPPDERSVGNSDHALTFTLFGRGNQYLTYIVHALRSAGEKGLRSGPCMELAAVEQDTEPGGGNWKRISEGRTQLTPFPPSRVPVPTPPPRLRIDLVTPLRLRYGEQYITPERFQFSDLFRSLLRRISLLTYFHTDTPLETDFAFLTKRCRQVELAVTELRWHEWTRYSSRQKTKLEMGGLTGHFEMETAGLDDLWTYLWIGQWTHVGKGTSMGLGQYRIADAHESRRKLLGEEALDGQGTK